MWFMKRYRDFRFLVSFVIKDEASFFMNGRVNSHNVLAYAPKGNPPDFYYDKNDSRCKISVWAGLFLFGNCALIRPFSFNDNINCESYLNLLRENIIHQLQIVFENQLVNNEFCRLWWAQFGAPAHHLLASQPATELLQQVFQNHVVALYQNTNWPPRSPDLTPCD